MQVRYYSEHAALTAGTNIDISGLNYDILKDKRSVQWPIQQKKSTETERRDFLPIRNFILPPKSNSSCCSR